MDALVREAGDYLSVKSRDLGFFHKSRRKTHASRLASHFRYCQPNECSPSLTRASDGGDVLYSKLDQDTGWLKVTKFPVRLELRSPTRSQKLSKNWPNASD